MHAPLAGAHSRSRARLAGRTPSRARSNAHLTRAKVAVAILAASNVDENFDARFSATARHYRYLILNRRAPAALERSRVCMCRASSITRPWHEAAPGTGGRHHDFNDLPLRPVPVPKARSKTLDLLAVERDGDMIAIRGLGALLPCTTRCDRWLERSSVSARGSLDAGGSVRKALEARDRAACGPVAGPPTVST